MPRNGCGTPKCKYDYMINLQVYQLSKIDRKTNSVKQIQRLKDRQTVHLMINHARHVRNGLTKWNTKADRQTSRQTERQTDKRKIDRLTDRPSVLRVAILRRFNI